MIRQYFNGLLFLLLLTSTLISQPVVIQKYIMIDQFGYRPDDPKVAVIVDPQIGFNEKDAFEPGKIYQVRRRETDEIVYSGEPVIWNDGAIDFTAGDKGWWFDFSAVKTEGSFYIFDAERQVGSYEFKIAKNIYRELLRIAMRTFYYQRLNDPKQPPFAEEPWTDEAAFLGTGQDREARFLNDKNNPATARDLSGGWMDAGDYNKYVTFAGGVIHDLLTAFEQNPKAFTDDFNIPESGNGRPDLIDEVKYELDWIKKMQEPDGGVLIKMGNVDYNVSSPPSRDRRPRFYGPKCSSSTITTAGVFAHAARVLKQFPELGDYAKDLQKRALNAWNWYLTNPRCDTCDSQEIKSGDADQSLARQDEIQVLAAIYLFALTGENQYHEIVKNNFYILPSFYDTGSSLYFSFLNDALLFYTSLPGSDQKVKNVIIQKQLNEAKGKDIFQFNPQVDLYRAYIPLSLYTWGTHNPRAATGSANFDFIYYHLDSKNHSKYLNRALGILHYFHGVNPLGIVYLTNMNRYGGDNCINEIWHDWFQYNTKWDKNPAPGYIPGGPNAFYGGSLTSLKMQPAQKTYLDWNGGWPENSWEITEPAIYYQASYIKLLSKFVGTE